MIDYKFWFIRRDDNGFITQAAIRFYEGTISAELERQPKGDTVSITRYRRTKRLQKADLSAFQNKPFVKELSRDEAVLYTAADFGQIKTDDELRDFLDEEISKDGRPVIPEQNKTISVNLRKHR